MSKLSILFLSLVLVGAGCTMPQFPGQATPEEREANAEALQLDTGSELVIRGTVLGFGGSVSEDLGSDVGRRTVTVSSYTPGSSADLDWALRVRRETEVSEAARAEYNETVEGIQDDAPEPPQREYEEVDVTGSLASSALNDAEAVFLPAYWQEGNQGSLEGNSLLWLSTKQYEELTEDRESTLSIGLFEDVLKPLELADNVSNALNRLKGEAEEASRYKDIYKLTAQPEFSSTRVTVDGERQQVRTIQATNWFGTYTILANPENPLILKVTLNPLSFGTLSLLSPTKVLDAFLGYEVVEVTL